MTNDTLYFAEDSDQIGTKSILKESSTGDTYRRSSLQVSIDSSYSESSTGTTKGILKRKYSYDNNISKLSNSNFTTDLKEYSSSEQCLHNYDDDSKMDPQKTKPILKNARNKSMDENCSFVDDMDIQHPRPILKNNNRSASIPATASMSSSLGHSDPDLKSCFKKQTVSLEEPLTSSKGNGASIAQKIAALRMNGETEWKKRVPMKQIPASEGVSKMLIKGEIPVAQEISNLKPDMEDSQEKIPSPKSILAERLKQLDQAQESWKKRIPVAEKDDVNKYTVEGKLKRDGKITAEETSRKHAPQMKEKSKEFESLENLNESNESDFSFKRTFSLRLNGKKVSSGKSMAKVATTNCASLMRNSSQTTTGAKQNAYTEVQVFQNDNETFSAFFKPVNPLEVKHEKSDDLMLTEESFKSIIMDENSHNYLLRDHAHERRNVRMARKHGNSRNPVKSLALRLQSGQVQTYKDLSPEEREKQAKRLQIQQQLSMRVSYSWMIGILYENCIFFI